MNAVTVTVKHELVTMTLTEAERLQNELQLAIRRARSATNELLSPMLTCDGYITHSAMYEFFGQIYEPNSANLANHAGKLFNRITCIAWAGGSGINVICSDCRNFVHEVRSCPVVCDSHSRTNVNLKIEAASLKKNAEAFIEAGHKGVGSAIINDLRMLCAYL